MYLVSVNSHMLSCSTGWQSHRSTCKLFLYFQCPQRQTSMDVWCFGNSKLKNPCILYSSTRELALYFCFSLLSFICKHSQKIIAPEDQVSCNESAEGLVEVSKNIKHTFLPLLLPSGSHAAASSGVLPLFLSPSPDLSFLLGTSRG